MDLHRPRRLLGLFSKAYTKQCSSARESAAACGGGRSSYDSGDYSIPADDSHSIYSNDEVAIIQIREQRDIVLKELQLTKENLAAEKKVTHELNQRLIMKAISIDCQLADNEEKYKKTLAKKESLSVKNNELSDKLRIIQKENQNLMKRTAALARRDQIQKATIMTSNAEILKLMSTIEVFQERFLTLADAVVTVNDDSKAEAEKEMSIKPSDDETEFPPISPQSSEEMTPFEQDCLSSPSSSPTPSPSMKEKKREIEEMKKKEEKLKVEKKTKEEEQRKKDLELKIVEENRKKLEAWQSERMDLFGCIEKLKANNKDIKTKFVQTLKKHQWKWHKAKEKLLKKIGDLEVTLEEKEAELMLTSRALEEVTMRDQMYPNKYDEVLETQTTQDESLSTTSSQSSLTLTYSLTETSNNLSTKGKNIKKIDVEVPKTQKLDIVEPVDSGSYSYDVTTDYENTPPRSNGQTFATN